MTKSGQDARQRAGFAQRLHRVASNLPAVNLDHGGSPTQPLLSDIDIITAPNEQITIRAGFPADRPYRIADEHAGRMDIHTVGGSAPEEPPEERMAAFARRMNPPENEIPAAVAISALLARTEDVAIALVGAHAYTFGLRFDLVIRLRNEPHGAMAHRVYDLLGGHPGLEYSDERLLLGVEYADGRTATNLRSFGFRGMPADDDPVAPSLSPMGGGGGGRSFDQSFWLTPLPPAGPLVVVCAWSAFEIPESRTVLDGAAIMNAGSRAVVLWPPSPPGDEEPVEPPEPRIPEGGWFARVNRAERGTDGSISGVEQDG